MIATRALIAFGGLITVLAGRRAQTHSEDTPRYTAGYGSGFSSATRRFIGGIVFAFGLVLVASAAFGVPAEIMR